LTSTDVRALALCGTNLFAGTSNNGVFLSTNSGTSWTAASSGLTNTSVTSLAVSGTNFFAGTYGGVFVSTNSGTSWTVASSGLSTNLIVWSLGVSSTNLFAGTNSNGVYRIALTDFTFPVELNSFTGLAGGTTVALQWTTATEINNYGFDIERDLNNSWTKIGFVAGNGSSNVPHSYSYTDNVGSVGTYSYRLKQIDHDGAFVYSQAVQVKIAVPKVLTLSQNYPEPFNSSTTIQFTVPNNGRATLRVYNAIGQEVATLFNDEAAASVVHQVQFNGSNLASGIYLSRLEFGGKIQAEKMLLLK